MDYQYPSLKTESIWMGLKKQGIFECYLLDMYFKCEDTDALRQNRWIKI